MTGIYTEQFPEVTKTIAEWSKKEHVEVLFDSQSDDWCKTTSEFGEKILGKKDLFIIVHDLECNIFGGYVSETVAAEDEWVEDKECFLFNLESNGRFKEPMRYPIKAEKSKHAFVLFGKDFDGLFQFGYGYDIIVTKQDHVDNFLSGVNESAFEYQGVKTPLVTSKTIVVSRIVVLNVN